MNIFISHSSNESKIASELCQVLESNGNTCFIAPRDIRSGYEYAEEITNGLDGSEAVLLVLSKGANQSPHVLREVERAVTKSIPILVYKVEEVQLTKSMEYFLMTHQWMAAGEHSYEDVLRCIRQLEEGKTAEKMDSTRVEKERDEDNQKIAKRVILVMGILLVVSIVSLILVFANKPNPQSTEVTNQITKESPKKNSQETVKEELPEQTDVDIKMGDTIVMGKYNGEDIFWRVLRLSEDGTKATVVSRDVITVKAYDAPDSGTYNRDEKENYSFSGTAVDTDMKLQAFVRGNSNWETSNIRTWLNSSSENVEYEGQVPSSAAMADGRNGYHTEKGFLCNFTEEERGLIQETQIETKGNALAEEEMITTRDKVFLLSQDELKWFEEANVSLLAEPTQGAIANNQTSWYQDYCVDMGVKHMMWWLRDPVETSSSKCYLVGNGYHEENIYDWEVGVESFGIRPAMIIAVTSDIQVEKK